MFLTDCIFSLTKHLDENQPYNLPRFRTAKIIDKGITTVAVRNNFNFCLVSDRFTKGIFGGDFNQFENFIYRSRLPREILHKKDFGSWNFELFD
jgi:hypothetical protein